MKTLICTVPGRFDYSQGEAPALSKGRSIIKIKRVGICGTDLHAFEGTQPFFSYPRILGHELSGELIASDGAPGFTLGEELTFIPYFHCGNCIACRSGKPNCCSKIKVCGVHVDGGMVEYLSVPSSSLVHGQGLGYDALALVEPLAIGAHGVRRAYVQQGEYVLVMGAGPIGLGTMEFARIAGGKVIALDVNEDRLEMCRDLFNIDHLINPNTSDVVSKLAEITGGDMPSVVIDATGSQKAINKGFQYLSHGGRYVLIGLQKEDITINHPEFHKREATLMSSRNATREDFKHVISCIKKGDISPGTYITHRIPFGQVKEDFERLLDPVTGGLIKAMVELG